MPLTLQIAPACWGTVEHAHGQRLTSYRRVVAMVIRSECCTHRHDTDVWWHFVLGTSLFGSLVCPQARPLESREASSQARYHGFVRLAHALHCSRSPAHLVRVSGRCGGDHLVAEVMFPPNQQVQR